MKNNINNNVNKQNENKIINNIKKDNLNLNFYNINKTNFSDFNNNNLNNNKNILNNIKNNINFNSNELKENKHYEYEKNLPNNNNKININFENEDNQVNNFNFINYNKNNIINNNVNKNLTFKDFVNNDNNQIISDNINNEVKDKNETQINKIINNCIKEKDNNISKQQNNNYSKDENNIENNNEENKDKSSFKEQNNIKKDKYNEKNKKNPNKIVPNPAAKFQGKIDSLYKQVFTDNIAQNFIKLITEKKFNEICTKVFVLIENNSIEYIEQIYKEKLTTLICALYYFAKSHKSKIKEYIFKSDLDIDKKLFDYLRTNILLPDNQPDNQRDKKSDNVPDNKKYIDFERNKANKFINDFCKDLYLLDAPDGKNLIFSAYTFLVIARCLRENSSYKDSIFFNELLNKEYLLSFIILISLSLLLNISL